MAEQIVKKHFVFTVSIGDVQFNNLGSYYLKLSVQSTYTKDYSGLWIRDSLISKGFRPGHAVRTNVVHHQKKKDVQKFQGCEFSFFLPKGFCRNDADHDVYLLVEAFQIDDTKKAERRVGECKYAIFPRTNKPRANLYAAPGENMYKHTDVWTLLRTMSSGNLQMHCGRMRCVTTFSEMTNLPEDYELEQQRLRMKTPEKIPEPPKPRPPIIRTPEVTEDKPDIDDMVLPRTPSPDFEFEDRGTILESPQSPTGRGLHTADQLAEHHSHVARPNMEDVVFILHGATNLPSKLNGDIPQAYCVLKMQADELHSRSISDVPAQPTYSPSYHQRFVVQYDRHHEEGVLMVRFADKVTKEILITYRLPVALLHPFHQYHLEMIMPAPHSRSGVRVFASVMRRTATLPQDLSSPNFLAFEVFLQGVEQRLKIQAGEVIAVARIVPDYHSYHWANARETSSVTDNLVHNGGVSVTTVTFPSPNPAVFAVADSNTQGYPQITLPGGPPIQPEWNHPFLFSQRRDNATLFTPSAALVIEYFQATNSVSDMSWRLGNPVGFSALLLDHDVYRQLTANQAKCRVNVHNLPVQGTNLRTFHDKPPTVGLIIRLITSNRPTALVVPSQPHTLPNLQFVPQMERDLAKIPLPSPTPPQPIVQPETSWKSHDPPSPPHTEELQSYWFKQRVIKKDIPAVDENGLLPHDAMERILPEYQYIFIDPNRKPKAQGTRLTANMEKTSLHMLEYQMQEVEKYRVAIRKMGADILKLRVRIRELEASNSQLRRDLARYNDSTMLMLDSHELDGLSKKELAIRYVTIKQKLLSQEEDLKERKDQVQKLHNQLIEHNNMEKELLKVSQVHSSQNNLLHQLQDRNQWEQRLEVAWIKQQRVIEKMEGLLTDKEEKDSSDTELYSHTDALREENQRLLDELDGVREQNRLLSLGKDLKHEQNEEKLILYQQLEREESRVISLERQLAEDARKWGHEKQNLLSKLFTTELQRTIPTRKAKKASRYSYNTSLDHTPGKYSKAHLMTHSTKKPFNY